MSERHARNPGDSPFLTAPPGRLFLSNALPMAVVMSMGGILTVTDGLFVGRYLGAEALAAVSLAFPAVMLLTALSSLSGGGMASLMARHLGAGDRNAAAAVLAGAQGLALALCALLLFAALAAGPQLVAGLAGGNGALAETAGRYLLVLVLGAPLQFGLALHGDALRSEGHAGQIALLSVFVNLANIAANWLAIAGLGLGVAGSALGTVAAQGLGLALLLALRLRDPRLLPPVRPAHRGWGAILALGLPVSLGLLGMALVSATVVLAIGDDAGLLAAHGVATRLLGLAFLPQMAIALATQTIAGHNAGAGHPARALRVRNLAMAAAFGWCLAVALAGSLFGESLGRAFGGDARMAASVAAILRVMLALYAFSGPVLVLALYLQALGRPRPAAVLTLAKPWLLVPVLVPLIAARAGPTGLWAAFPVADAVLLALAVAILFRAPRHAGPDGQTEVLP
ncbi:MATE family efflux transporter [Poseidonocella sp. HB161398]|uniref:MATE family efflux transporter n=1 Tax=Poseidonocella sp. HB161398 TaxID=2320855 RepID=UPI001F0F5943|nr:MATE family efflux transporter [Poseidonocella sp. HB161398]